MAVLRWVWWPVLLLPAVWWAWQALHAPPTALTLDSGAQLEWVDCWFDTPVWRPVHCGQLHTAPEPGHEANPFTLPVVYIPQPFWERRGTPIQYLAGGPGGAAWIDTDEIGFWLEWVTQTGWDGDLVLYDQRGVGLSQPAIDCPELQALRRELLPLPLPTEETYRRVRSATRSCHDRLRDEGVDLTRYTTVLNAADAIDLMRAMGMHSWRVYSVSYGTRIALEMMRQAPQHLDAVVLDSVYPPQVNAELSDAWLLQRAFELFGRICGLADECAATPDELAELLDGAFARVAQQSIKLSVRDPRSGRDIAVVYDEEDLAWLLFEALYQWDVIATLPDSMRALGEEGRLDPSLRGLIQDSVDMLLDDSISDAVATAVDCHDNGPVDLREAEAQLRQYPRAAPFKRFDWQYNACRFWQSGESSAAFRSAVESDVPTLLLAGEFDPVTPPEWAELAAGSLSHAVTFVFPAVGHGVLDSHVCAAELVRAFFAEPHAARAPKCLSAL